MARAADRLSPLAVEIVEQVAVSLPAAETHWAYLRTQPGVNGGAYRRGLLS